MFHKMVDKLKENTLKIGWLLGLVVLVIGSSGQNTIRSVGNKKDIELNKTSLEEHKSLTSDVMTKEQATWLIKYFDLSLSTVIEYLPEDQKEAAKKRLDEIRNFRDIGLPGVVSKTNYTEDNLILQASISDEQK